MKNMILAPSILAADFCDLGKDIRMTEENGAEYLHFDIMDGIFVPNISFGSPVLGAVRQATKQIIDVHLMVQEPIRFIGEFAKQGADIITIHLEACEDVQKTIDEIKSKNVKCGISIKPGTPVEALQPYLAHVDMVLIMSVEPGQGGQAFLPSSIDRIQELKDMEDEAGVSFDIEVDGGIYPENIQEVLDAGANVIVAGSAVFKGDIAENTKTLMEILRKNEK